MLRSVLRVPRGFPQRVRNLTETSSGGTKSRLIDIGLFLAGGILPSAVWLLQYYEHKLEREKWEHHKSEAAWKNDRLRRSSPTVEERRALVVQHFAAEMEKAEKTRDPAKMHRPFLQDTPLEQAIKEGILDTRRGAVILCAPKNAGKSTRAISACRELKAEGSIAGFVYVDLDASGATTGNAPAPWTIFRNQFGATDEDGVNDILPENSDRPVVLVLDNVDDHPDLPAIRGLVKNLAKATIVQPSGQHYVVLALCQQLDCAVELLTINQGEKVRMLEYGDVLVDGTPDAAPGTWKSTGIKWNRQLCDTLIKRHEQDADNALEADQRERLLTLATAAGTPGFIRDFFSQIKDGNLQQVNRILGDYQVRSEKLAEEWEALKAVENPQLVKNCKELCACKVNPSSPAAYRVWPT